MGFKKRKKERNEKKFNDELNWYIKKVWFSYVNDNKWLNEGIEGMWIFVILSILISWLL